MKRLIAFGGNNSFGLGLDTTFVLPSQKSYPFKLAANLKLKCLNLSIPYITNFEILNTIINFKFRETDFVIVGWTTPYRETLIEEPFLIPIAKDLVPNLVNSREFIITNYLPRIKKLNKKFKNKFASFEYILKKNLEYYNLFKDNDIIEKSWSYQNIAGKFLQSNNIKYIFTTVGHWKNNHPLISNYIHMHNYIDKYIDEKIFCTGSDNLHMSEKVHDVHAKNLEKIYNQLMIDKR